MIGIKPVLMAARGSTGGFVGCFLTGSRIATSEGSVCVEELTVGALVMTHSGQARPVRWLGHRGIDCSRYADPAVVWPICIRAGAFSEHQPARDLWVSPGHSILVDGMLMQAGTLVNGASILQVARERVEYWHVELDSHDILIAEGLPAESYLDIGNRTAFIEGGDFLEAYPDFQPKHCADFCRPLVLQGPALHSAKAALLARAHELGYGTTDDPDVHVMADGKRIDPVSLSDKRLAFALPAARSAIELRSRTFVPAHMEPTSDDQRSLGICVGRLQIDGTDVALDDEARFGLGWHRLEGTAGGRQWRWSQDRTPLPTGTRFLVIDMCWPVHYWAEPAGAAIALTG